MALNIVAGSSRAEQRGYGDPLDHDERYARTDEFLTICRALWCGDAPVNFSGDYYHIEGGRINTPFQAPERRMPELYVAGHSEQAVALALRQRACWIRLIDTPEALAPVVAPFRAQGLGVCLRLGMVCRPTWAETLDACAALLPEGTAISRQERRRLLQSESRNYKDALAQADAGTGWRSRHVWAGLVPHYGSSAVSLVGPPEELAAQFLAYKAIGITQFIIAGMPKLDEMIIFGRDVLPLIRKAERCETVHP